MRVFVAVEISETYVLDSIKKFQKEISISSKPVEPENLHFTLQFLGEISEESCEKIKQSLKTIEFSSFKINFKGVGVFPNMRSPKVIWVGVDDISAKKLENLAMKIKNTLNSLGYSPDKTFKPHITIFRIKNKIEEMNNYIKKFRNYELGSTLISDFKLKKSILTPHGPIYSDLEVIKSI